MHVAQLLTVVRRSHLYPLHLTGRVGAILNWRIPRARCRETRPIVIHYPNALRYTHLHRFPYIDVLVLHIWMGTQALYWVCYCSQLEGFSLLGLLAHSSFFTCLICLIYLAWSFIRYLFIYLFIYLLLRASSHPRVNHQYTYLFYYVSCRYYSYGSLGRRLLIRHIVSRSSNPQLSALV